MTFEEAIIKYLKEKNQNFKNNKKLFERYEKGLIDFKSPVHTLDQHLESLVESLIVSVYDKEFRRDEAILTRRELKGGLVN